jgi:hypothetical protein
MKMVIFPLVIYTGWTLGLHVSRRCATSKLLGACARFWEGLRPLLTLAVTFGICMWIRGQFPDPLSPSLLVALIGCTLAGYDFGSANADAHISRLL